jgi:hypothetical protein
MVGYSFPVEQGIVHSLARPGGNITGFRLWPAPISQPSVWS